MQSTHISLRLDECCKPLSSTKDEKNLNRFTSKDSSYVHLLLLIICLLFLFAKMESINYQFIACLQHLYICTVYWGEADTFPEASFIRTDRRSIKRAVSMLVV